MSFDKCEFCGFESTADTARSVVNRHIRVAAEKPAEKRGNHPGKNTPQYQRVVENRKFIQPAASDQERRERISDSGAKYREKRTARDSKKVEAAFKILQYVPIPSSRQCFFLPDLDDVLPIYLKLQDVLTW